MRNKLFLFGLAIVVAFSILFTSCEENIRKDLAKNTIDFETITHVKKTHLDNDSTKPFCSLKISYTYPSKFENEEVTASIISDLNYLIFDGSSYEALSVENAIEKYSQAYINNYEKETELVPLKRINTDVQKEYYSFYQIVEVEPAFNKANILCYKVGVKDYKTSINTSTKEKFIVFDLKTGKALKEKDIFKDDANQKLILMLKAKLMRAYKIKNIEDLLALGFYDTKDITPNDNFFVDETGLTYVFNERTIASPTIGQTKVHFSFSELKDILQPTTPLNALFN